VNAIVLLSGGIDSAAGAQFLLKSTNSVSPLFVNYGQPAASVEGQAAHRLALAMGLTLECIKVATSKALGAGEITGRNAFLVMSAVLSKAYTEPCQIALGIHRGTPYYDCSPAFIQSINRLIAEQSDGRL